MFALQIGHLTVVAKQLCGKDIFRAVLWFSGCYKTRCAQKIRKGRNRALISLLSQVRTIKNGGKCEVICDQAHSKPRLRKIMWTTFIAMQSHRKASDPGVCPGPRGQMWVSGKGHPPREISPVLEGALIWGVFSGHSPKRHVNGFPACDLLCHGELRAQSPECFPFYVYFPPDSD